MPPRAPSRNGDLASIADTGRGSEFRRTSSHHQPSRFAKETPLSPRATQSLKFKDKGARTENPIRPPNPRLPEFLKNDSSNDELVKYMSKVPGYLQKGEKIQDSVLNFGVLDWGRLEKWTHKESPSSTSHTGSSVDFSPVVKPMKEKVINHRKDKVKAVGVELKSAKGKEMGRKQESHMKSAKGKEKCLYQDTEVSGRSNKEPENTDAQQKKGSEDSIVLLLPKDFSRPSSSELPRKAAFHAKSGQHNWGSFSDLFSIDEIHADESFSDIPPSCSADPIVETEKDLDLKLDTLIKAQGVGVECPDKPQESSLHQRFGFGLARMTRSLSLKEGSIHPPLSSMYVTAKSGPAKTEGPLNVHVKARANPFKRLLDPILKSKVVSHTRKQSNDSVMEAPPVPVVPIVVPEVEICEALTVKALLHHTVKGGLPLFKFVVETNNEILASTVKSLSSLNKDEISLMYTFYSVQKVRKKSSGWKNQKAKPCRYGYNVVGQMKVSKESVLYSVDVSKSDAVSSEIVTGREIAAIVVNNLKDEKSAQTVVILPGGDHSQPHEGVASSLINRWRTGGLCDCGGWDEGCKLRILADLQDRKGQLCSRSGLMDIRCDLYDQGESKESSPLFRLVPFRDGLYSVEFDPKMSSLQAFSICVAVINNKQPTISSDACSAVHQVESKHEFGAGKASFVPAVHHTHPHPPVSPVGRV
ncbi:uncharacterized protein LOC141595325 [Silene latifolia]|uniref:uncharacterized protein LOC141595325 n=1 Tax=Silene latifolia TaxID=37657 RepID=UPI003D783727